MKKITLGIWDGHDSGAAFLIDNELVFAANEERFTRRKLEVHFPEESIKAGLKFLSLSASDISQVAISTSDMAKTLSRLYPSLKEQYYQIRRRKKKASQFNGLIKTLKYPITALPSNFLSKRLTLSATRKKLNALGFDKSVPIDLLDHHTCHAAAAALFSGESKTAVLTLDGIGDAASGGVWLWNNQELKELTKWKESSSLGLFFEHVTNLMNLRELEDEGKVMALANFACPIDDSKNPMLSFFEVSGMELRSTVDPKKLKSLLKEIHWRFPPEQFAFMAQRTLEVLIVKLVKNIIEETGMSTLAYAGGVASNVKVNRLIRENTGLRSLFVFPHMGDGGLAIGAACYSHFQRFKLIPAPLTTMQLGPNLNGTTHPETNYISTVAKAIAEGKVIFWASGRMELGPRSLGGRSILARADSTDVKDALNLRLKKRVWYQPFCPSMLERDAAFLLENFDVPNPFMTVAYKVRAEYRAKLQGVINVDGTCRPQILKENDPSPYAELLRAIRKETGLGVLLNTSFNLHGEPLVCSAKDCLKTFNEGDADLLVLDGEIHFRSNKSDQIKTA